MSRGISGGKQVIKFANTSSLFIPSKQNDNFILAKCTVRVSTSFMSLLLAVSTPTVNTAYKKVIMITSTHNSPFKIKSSFFVVQNNQTRPQFVVLVE